MQAAVYALKRPAVSAFRVPVVGLTGVVGLGLGLGCAADPSDGGAATGTGSGSTVSGSTAQGQSTAAGTATTSAGDASATSTPSGSDSTASVDNTGSTAAGSTDAPTGSSSGFGGSDSGTSTGALACAKTVVLMGYWPPTNEMLRPFSTDPVQNPGGWVGADWRGLGFDVYAFFPEFPPDGDPTNDPIGSPGSVGADGSDLQVDYQDTSADFWSIVDTVQPHILITHSRGGGIGWEIEAVEGGHGNGGPNPALDWISDGYGGETQPSDATVDPRSWAAMTTYRDETVGSLLPLGAIEDAATGLGLTSVQIDTAGTSGNYLSGFLGLHGIVYTESTAHAVAGGHIHVGGAVAVEDARALTDASLEAVLLAHPADALDCPSPR